MEQEKEVNPFEQSLMPYDPVVLVLDALKKWLIVVVISLICGMIAYVYTDTGYVPYYKTSATMVLTTRDSASTVYDNLDSTTRLATVFTEVLNSSVMRNNILAELEMDAFDGSISATAIPETNLLTIQVTAKDPRTAFRVINALLESHDIVTYAVMGDIVLEVLEPPVVPTSPANWVDSRSAMKRVTVVVALVLFLGFVVMAYIKDVVRSKQEAEQKLDCWCLGEVYHERKKHTLRRLLTRKKQSILITDPETAFRYVTTMSKLRRRVEQHMHKGKVLMVTSVMENEGKSTISANLALAMSKKYKRVLLIDLDLRKPACRRIMEHEVPRYWTQDVISGNAKLEDAVKTDKLSRLDMLFARHSKPQEATDLVGSDGLPALIEQARRLYDFVVIDMPPMAVAPDPETVMEYADGSLLVVRQNGVYTTDLNRAIADLQRGRAKMLGCVLNNVISTGLFSGEGYKMGYGRYTNYGKYGKYSLYAKKISEE